MNWCIVCPTGKKWIDAAVDLPFALPTSVAGLTLATVYGEEGILGRLLMSLGVNVVYTRLGVAVAMVFVSFPFVVRTMQPVLQVGMTSIICWGTSWVAVPCAVHASIVLQQLQAACGITLLQQQSELSYA